MKKEKTRLEKLVEENNKVEDEKILDDEIMCTIAPTSYSQDLFTAYKPCGRGYMIGTLPVCKDSVFGACKEKYFSRYKSIKPVEKEGNGYA
ncbi:MAG: hypothetical protein KAR06_10060 [Deltaproteobacteria bacterium]|nr:hypothetical protein [Deltaproteobacteria bacterium]